MKIPKKESVFEGEYLRFVRKHFKAGKGEEGIWETMERKNIYNNGAVVIVALSKERELILERRWRAPLEAFVSNFLLAFMIRRGS